MGFPEDVAEVIEFQFRMGIFEVLDSPHEALAGSGVGCFDFCILVFFPGSDGPCAYAQAVQVVEVPCDFLEDSAMSGGFPSFLCKKCLEAVDDFEHVLGKAVAAFGNEVDGNDVIGRCHSTCHRSGGVGIAA